MKWITREHVKVDRVACPWLIKKFVDQDAEFLFVPTDQVMELAGREGAIPYDVKNVELGHHGKECSFEAILKKYNLTGDLTIKGTTKPITLDVLKYGEFNDPNMGHRIGYAAQGQLNRKDYGMRFDMMLDGQFIVSNEIQINIEGELVEEKVPAEKGATPASADQEHSR